MKLNLSKVVTISLLIVVFTLPVLAQRANQPGRVSPNAVVSQNIDTTVVTIEYGRPACKGRTIWGELVPYDKVWRTGANEATTLTVSEDVLIEGQKLAAGTYSLFTVPGKEEWTVVINKTAKQWGHFRYDQTQDALRVKVKPLAAGHSEWFNICFDDLSPKGAKLILQWEKLAVPVSIEKP